MPFYTIYITKCGDTSYRINAYLVDNQSDIYPYPRVSICDTTNPTFATNVFYILSHHSE